MTKYFLWSNDAGMAFDSRNYPTLFINKITRPLMPDISTTQIKAGKRAGSYLQKNSLESYEIVIDITFLSDNDEDLRKDLRGLAKALYSDRNGKLTLSDELDIYVNCKLTGNYDFDNYASMAEGSLTFILSDPFGYKTTESNTLFVGQSANLVVNGYPIYPRFRMVPATNMGTIRIDNITTGKFFLLTGTFVASTAYIFDCEKNIFYRESDGLRMMTAVDLASDFFSLETGINTIVITNPTSGVSMRAYYRDRYL